MITKYTKEIERLVGDRFSFEQLENKLQLIMGVTSDLILDVEQTAIDRQCLMGIDQNSLYGYIDIYYLETHEVLDNGDKVYYITEVNVSDD